MNDEATVTNTIKAIGRHNATCARVSHSERIVTENTRLALQTQRHHNFWYCFVLS